MGLAVDRDSGFVVFIEHEVPEEQPAENWDFASLANPVQTLSPSVKKILVSGVLVPALSLVATIALLFRKIVLHFQVSTQQPPSPFARSVAALRIEDNWNKLMYLVRSCIPFVGRSMAEEWAAKENTPSEELKGHIRKYNTAKLANRALPGFAGVVKIANQGNLYSFGAFE